MQIVTRNKLKVGRAFTGKSEYSTKSNGIVLIWLNIKSNNH